MKTNSPCPRRIVKKYTTLERHFALICPKFAVLFPYFRDFLPYFLKLKRHRRESTQRGPEPRSEAQITGFRAQADLRVCSDSLRFAMNVARRAPRAHGITVSFFAAAATTPLMKRVLVFMALILSLFIVGVCPCLRLNMTE